MTSSTPAPVKTSEKRHSRPSSVHFESLSSDHGSDGECLSSKSSEEHLPHEPSRREDALGVREEEQDLKHLDELGLALEKTFQKVESIDAYVNKLRLDFDHEKLSEQCFMKSICSARIARAACCKKQVQAWRELQHGILGLCCHHQQQHEALSSHSDDCEVHHACDALSTSSHDSDVDALLGQLTKLSTFDLVKQRLDPEADARSFVEHWIMNNHHDDTHQEEDSHH